MKAEQWAFSARDTRVPAPPPPFPAGAPSSHVPLSVQLEQETLFLGI